MSKPTIASTTPYPLEVEAGKTYFWCACGKSASQPFCDGSHKGTAFSPVKYTAPRDKIVFFCGCKQTATGPVCDGSHTQVDQTDAEPGG
jgi:CDGSH-type Zn-finger protein